MRSLSAGALVRVLPVAFAIFWGLLSGPVFAQSGITIGLPFSGSGLVVSSEQGDELGRYLEDRLSIPVKVQGFTSEAPLYSRLTHSHDIDIAWFSSSFLEALPAREFSPLVRNDDHASGLLRGEIVARQEINTELRQQMQATFLNMHESPDGRVLLSKLDTSHFTCVPPEELASMQQIGVMEVSPASAVKEKSKQESVTTPPSGTGSEAPISLVSDYLAYNSEDDIYEAQGDVVFRQAGAELKAEEILWQAVIQDVAAQGSVQLNDAGTRVSGELLQYNVATAQGQIHEGRVFVREGNFHLAGEQIEKRGQANYFVNNGSFTTCDGEIPDWKFSAREVDVTLGGYARAWDVWFHIKDVPVLYTPYLEFPVQTERQSGLLMPSFGYSNNRGTLASLAWYQVIDRHLDATIYLDYLSEIGLGKGIEYRYALANQNYGEARYYHVTGLKETPDLYYLEWKHRGKLPGGWRLTADIEHTDKKLFFEEFGEVAEEYNRDKTVSTLILQRNWQKLNLVSYARYINDLETNNNASLQRLPELGLGLSRYHLGDTPFYIGLESYATRFQRDQGEDGERLYLRPSLEAVFTPGSWLEIVPGMALHQQLYNTDTGNEERLVPEFSLVLATRLVKNFDINRWSIDRIQHSIEPKVIYTYVPDKSQDNLPKFDLFDRIERQNDVAYALVNRLTIRSTAADGSSVYRELLNLRLSQKYDIDEARNNRSGANQPFSDVRVELDFLPTRNISLDAESLIPVYGDVGFSTLRVGSSVRDNTGNSVTINYSYKDVDFGAGATDYMNFQLYTPVLKPVYLSFGERYDFRAGRVLEKVFGLEYRAKCWSVLMTYRNRYQEDSENDNEFMVTFFLAGLGQDQGFGYGFGAAE